MKKVAIMTIFDEEDETITQEETEETTTVRTVEMNPKIVDLYNRTQASEKLTCGKSNLKMPEQIAFTVLTIKKQHPERSMNSIINTVLVKNAQMLTGKGVKYVEKGNISYCNHYTINFMPSGAGKDRMSDELDKFVYYPYRNWFKCRFREVKEAFRLKLEQEARRQFPEEDKQKQRKKYVEEQMKEFGNVFLEVSDGTREGLFRDAKVLKKLGFGSIVFKIAEISQFFKNMTTEQKLLIDTIFEAYSGIIRAKSIKGEHREEDIEDLPVNILFYSDPTAFKSDLSKIFNLLMETGLSRRCTITFMSKLEHYKMEPNGKKAYKAEEKYYGDLKAIGLQLYEIFEKVEDNAQYELTEETFVKVFYPYRLKLKSMMEKEENSLIQKEICSRELKALKISCQYACLNHPKEFFINPEDMEMAIDTVETLSKDFKKFLNYRPSKNDGYDELFSLFLDNLGVEFNKNTLVTKHYLLTGHSRKFFRDNFDDYIEILSEIAQERGYVLNQRPINNNSGCAYWLSTNTPEPLHNATVELDDLL